MKACGRDERAEVSADDDAGHDFAADEALAKAQIAEYLAFAMRHTGLEVRPG